METCIKLLDVKEANNLALMAYAEAFLYEPAVAHDAHRDTLSKFVNPNTAKLTSKPFGRQIWTTLPEFGNVSCFFSNPSTNNFSLVLALYLFLPGLGSFFWVCFLFLSIQSAILVVFHDGG